MNVYNTLRRIYTRKYIAINVAAFAIYYLIARYLIILQESAFIIVNPYLFYLMYLLVFSASITITIAIYSIRNTRRNIARFTASGVSAITALLGSVIISCGCAVPILFSLAAIGVSGASIIALNDFFSKYAIWLVSTFIFLNLLLIIYYLNKLSKPYCSVKKVKR
ncbi:MAG: hypothetical protein QXR58_01475 [Candidatus Micrarchaeaceae archaeon]